MTKILHIDSSPRGDRSVSRTLAKEFIEKWQSAYSDDIILYKDLGHNPVPHVSEPWVEGAFTPPEEHSPEAQKAISVSDKLVNEFLSVDRYVISSPMYNLNIPSTFKAFIDQIVRVNLTFSSEYQGLVHGKKMLVITSRGLVFTDGPPWDAYDFQEPYLRAIFGFIGITDITFVHCEGTNLGDDIRNESIAKARAELKELVTKW